MKASGDPRFSDTFPQIFGELVEANSITMAGFPSPDDLDCSLFSSQELDSEALSLLSSHGKRLEACLNVVGHSEDRFWAVMSSLSEPSMDFSPVSRPSPVSSLPSV